MPPDRRSPLGVEVSFGVARGGNDEVVPRGTGCERPARDHGRRPATNDEERLGVGAEVPHRSPRNVPHVRIGPDDDVDAAGIDVHVLGPAVERHAVAHDRKAVPAAKRNHDEAGEQQGEEQERQHRRAARERHEERQHKEPGDRELRLWARDRFRPLGVACERGEAERRDLQQHRHDERG